MKLRACDMGLTLKWASDPVGCAVPGPMACHLECFAHAYKGFASHTTACKIAFELGTCHLQAVGLAVSHL